MPETAAALSPPRHACRNPRIASPSLSRNTPFAGPSPALPPWRFPLPLPILGGDFITRSLPPLTFAAIDVAAFLLVACFLMFARWLFPRRRVLPLITQPVEGVPSADIQFAVFQVSTSTAPEGCLSDPQRAVGGHPWLRQAGGGETLRRPGSSPLPQLDEFGLRKEWTKCFVPDVPEAALADVSEHLQQHVYDVLVDVRDARLPQSSLHPQYQELAKIVQAHIVCYTHAERLRREDLHRVAAWTEHTHGPSTAVFFLDLRRVRRMDRKQASAALRPLRRAVAAACRAGGGAEALVAGLPNAGKSSLLHPLARRFLQAAWKRRSEDHMPQVACKPGTTTSVLPYPIACRPQWLWGIDTPGLDPPATAFQEDPELGFKLFLTGHLRRGRAPCAVDVADYVLWKCNWLRHHFYVPILKLQGPTDDIQLILRQFMGVADYGDPRAEARAAECFLGLAAEHGFDRLVLDPLPLPAGAPGTLTRPLHFPGEGPIIATNFRPESFRGPQASTSDLPVSESGTSHAGEPFFASRAAREEWSSWGFWSEPEDDDAEVQAWYSRLPAGSAAADNVPAGEAVGGAAASPPDAPALLAGSNAAPAAPAPTQKDRPGSPAFHAPVTPRTSGLVRSLQSDGPWTVRVEPPLQYDTALENALRVLRTVPFAVVLEVRDARIPRSTAHPLIGKVARQAAVHFVVFTHADLLPPAELQRVTRWALQEAREPDPHRQHATSVWFVNTKDALTLPQRETQRAFGRLYEALVEACRRTATGMVLVAGTPNVGKSSLVAMLTKELTAKRRKKGKHHVPRIVNAAGTTQGNTKHCFMEDPLLYMVDTPGLMLPQEVFHTNAELYFMLRMMNNCPEFPGHDPYVFCEYLIWKCRRLRFTSWLADLRLPDTATDVNLILDRLDPDPVPERRATTARRFHEMLLGKGLAGLVCDDLPALPSEASSAAPLPVFPDRLVLATDYEPGHFRAIQPVDLPQPTGKVPKKLQR